MTSSFHSGPVGEQDRVRLLAILREKDNGDFERKFNAYLGSQRILKVQSGVPSGRIINVQAPLS
jgi:hypothetical protein